MILNFNYCIKKIGDRISCYVIDNKGKECGTIYIVEDEYNDTRELLLSNVIYKPGCSIRSNMKRGVNTIKMIRSLLCFAMKKIPKYPYIVITDESYIRCVLPGNKHIEK